MTIQNGQVTVTDVATPVVPSSVAGGQVVLTNMGTNIAFLGGSGVTAATGVKFIADWAQLLPIGPGEAIYAICATGKTTVISYMITTLPQA